MDFKQEIAKTISKAIGIDENEIASYIEMPKDVKKF